MAQKFRLISNLVSLKPRAYTVKRELIHLPTDFELEILGFEWSLTALSLFIVGCVLTATEFCGCHLVYWMRREMFAVVRYLSCSLEFYKDLVHDVGWNLNV
jgi:hypothetical protein